MPIFRAGGGLHYFAHVPKCAGTSVEDYLAARFGPLALLDRMHLQRPRPARWTRTSPQHLPWAEIERLGLAPWLASHFAVVRHPLRRFASAYDFQVSLGRVPAGMGPEEWFEEYLALVDLAPWLHDNHLAPQTDFFGAAATVMRLEDGLGAVVAHLDRLSGRADGPREIGHGNRTGAPPGAPRAGEGAGEERREALAPRLVARLGAFYAKDFARLGYALEGEAVPRVRTTGRAVSAGRLRRRLVRGQRRFAARVGLDRWLRLPP